MEAHPDADDVVALLGSSAAATDESTPPDIATRIRLMPPTPWPRGSAATAAWPVRIEARTRGTISAAASISASVVVRPSDRRSAPRASSSG